MLKAVLTIPRPSISFANSPPGAHTVFRGSHTSILSFATALPKPVGPALPHPFGMLIKPHPMLSKNHAGDWSCPSALKLPPSFLQGVAGAKRGERANVPTGLCCAPACGQRETGSMETCEGMHGLREEINYPRKQGARGLGEPYHTPSTALHQQSSLKLPPLPPESSESGRQRRRAMGSCEYQWLVCLVHPLARCLLNHWPQEPTMELRVAISVHGTT